MSAGWSVIFGLGELGMTRWLEKPPDPLTVQAQEPKTRVVPSGTLLASLDPAIEFVDELAEPPYLARQLSVFTAKPTQGYP